jgi:hypothetical protein
VILDKYNFLIFKRIVKKFHFNMYELQRLSFDLIKTYKTITSNSSCGVKQVWTSVEKRVHQTPKNMLSIQLEYFDDICFRELSGIIRVVFTK